jgi:hypothetical protein
MANSIDKSLFSFPGFCPAKDRDLAYDVTLFYLAETPDSCCAASSEKRFPSILREGWPTPSAGVGWIQIPIRRSHQGPRQRRNPT